MGLHIALYASVLDFVLFDKKIIKKKRLHFVHLRILVIYLMTTIYKLTKADYKSISKLYTGVIFI